jgi:hypothetical protein
MLFDDTLMVRNIASVTDIFTLYTSFFLIIDLLSFSLQALRGNLSGSSDHY